MHLVQRSIRSESLKYIFVEKQANMTLKLFSIEKNMESKEVQGGFL